MKSSLFALSAATLAISIAGLSATHSGASRAAQLPISDVANLVVLPEGQTRMKDFNLSDQVGKKHRLYDLKDKAAVVLFWQGVGCPIVQQTTPALKDLRDKYAKKNIAILMVNSNTQDTPAMIKEETDKFDLDLPVLKDADQSLGKALGVVRTAEVVVIDPRKNWLITYHGPLDDRLTYGRARAKADNNWTIDVLDTMLAGKPVTYAHRPTDGCIISYSGS